MKFTRRMFISTIALLSIGLFLTNLVVKVRAGGNPANLTPSILKINSNVIRGVAQAPAGDAIISEGNSFSVWAKVQGVSIDSHIDSNVSPVSPASNPASSGAVLTANGTGGASWSMPNIPANGPAGGDLTGAFPNPTIAIGAVTGSKIAAGVIPTSLPPKGAAGGDLTGTYPNPLIGANTVTTSKLADAVITTSKLAVLPKCRYTLTVAQNMTGGGGNIFFNSKIFDTEPAGIINPADTTQFICKTPGTYLLTASLNAGNVTANLGFRVFPVGGAAYDLANTTSSGSANTSICVTSLVQLGAGDIITVPLGVTSNTTIGGGSPMPSFCMTYIP